MPTIEVKDGSHNSLMEKSKPYPNSRNPRYTGYDSNQLYQIFNISKMDCGFPTERRTPLRGVKL